MSIRARYRPPVTDLCAAAGQDATEAFFSLHRHEILLKPQYARLQIGSIQGSEPVIKPRASGELSNVPYAEPTWLADGFHSPYFKEVRPVCWCERVTVG